MNTLDTRDLNDRLEELQGLRDSLTEAKRVFEECEANLVRLEANFIHREEPSGDEHTNECVAGFKEMLAQAKESLETAEQNYDTQEMDELANLETLKDEVGSEWRHGVTLIPSDGFENYAIELAEDMGVVNSKQGWPLNCIDWEKAAKELKYDYSLVTFNDEDYYYQG